MPDQPKSDQYDKTVANGPLHAAAEIKALKMKVAALEKENASLKAALKGARCRGCDGDGVFYTRDKRDRVIDPCPGCDGSGSAMDAWLKAREVQHAKK